MKIPKQYDLISAHNEYKKGKDLKEQARLEDLVFSLQILINNAYLGGYNDALKNTKGDS